MPGGYSCSVKVSMHLLVPGAYRHIAAHLSGRNDI